MGILSIHDMFILQFKAAALEQKEQNMYDSV